MLYPRWGCFNYETPRPKGTSQPKSRSGASGRPEPRAVSGLGARAFPPLPCWTVTSQSCPQSPRPQPPVRTQAGHHLTARLVRPPSHPVRARPPPPPSGPPWAQTRSRGRLPSHHCSLPVQNGGGRRSRIGAFPPRIGTLGPSCDADTAPRWEPSLFPTSQSGVGAATPRVGPGRGRGRAWGRGRALGPAPCEAPPSGRTARAQDCCVAHPRRCWGWNRCWSGDWGWVV